MNIVEKMDAYLAKTSLNEAANLKPFVDVAKKVYDKIQDDFEQVLADEYPDEEDQKVADRASKKMQRFYDASIKGLDKFVKVISDVGAKTIKGETVDATIDTVSDIGCVLFLHMQSGNQSPNDNHFAFANALQPALVKALGSMYKEKSYFSWNKNVLCVAFGELSVKAPMPDYQEFSDLVKTSHNVAKFKITF